MKVNRTVPFKLNKFSGVYYWIIFYEFGFRELRSQFFPPNGSCTWSLKNLVWRITCSLTCRSSSFFTVQLSRFCWLRGGYCAKQAAWICFWDQEHKLSNTVELAFYFECSVLYWGAKAQLLLSLALQNLFYVLSHGMSITAVLAAESFSLFLKIVF